LARQLSTQIHDAQACTVHARGVAERPFAELGKVDVEYWFG